MQLRVRNGKGAKGRVLPLSKRLLKELVDYWRAQRQAKAGHNSHQCNLVIVGDQGHLHAVYEKIRPIPPAFRPGGTLYDASNICSGFSDGEYGGWHAE